MEGALNGEEVWVGTCGRVRGHSPKGGWLTTIFKLEQDSTMGSPWYTARCIYSGPASFRKGAGVAGSIGCVSWARGRSMRSQLCLGSISPVV